MVTIPPEPLSDRLPERLPTATWTQREDIRLMLDALDPDGREPDLCRYVGGAVRDTLLGLPVKDVDIATRLRPETVLNRLQDAAIKAVPTGIDHGTITAVLADGPVEITTLRRDVATDGRRATIAYSDDWREDAARRDFTINALYADPATLELTDFFGGRVDLAARQVRFIGRATERIAEDHLRILRYFRFFARFGGGDPDAEAIAACAAMAPTLKALSRERVAQELLALLDTADPLPAVRLMVAHRVLDEVLPDRAGDALDRLAALLGRERQTGRRAAALTRLAALLPRDPLQAARVAARLRLSKNRTNALVQLLTPLPDDALTPSVYAYRHGADAARERLLLEAADPGPGLAMLDAWQPPQFLLGGRDVLALGLEPGPKVAAVLQAAERAWIAEGFPDAARQHALCREAAARIAGKS